MSQNGVRRLDGMSKIEKRNQLYTWLTRFISAKMAYRVVVRVI